MQNYKTPRDNIGENLDDLRWGSDLRYNIKGTIHERKTWTSLKLKTYAL